MQPFLDSAHPEDRRQNREAIDWDSPDEQLMQAEDDDTDDDNDASRLKNVPPDALLVLLRFLIPTLNDRNQKKRWRIAQLRLAVLAHAAGLPEVADQSLADLGVELGCSRALVSLYAIRLTDSLEQSQVRGGKTRVSRESYRQSAIRSHVRAGHNMPSLKRAEDVL